MSGMGLSNMVSAVGERKKPKHTANNKTQMRCYTDRAYIAMLPYQV